jgi:hypothetical protein
VSDNGYGCDMSEIPDGETLQGKAIQYVLDVELKPEMRARFVQGRVNDIHNITTFQASLILYPNVTLLRARE